LTDGSIDRMMHASIDMHLEGHRTELDINPLMVLPSGQRLKAVDALAVFSRHTAVKI
jgi:hypothetical protein